MAHIKSIELDDNEEPEFVTVRLTLAEAAFIAKFTGQQSAVTAREVVSNGDVPSGSLYEAMTGGLFNRFYDGGVDEWVAEQ